MKPRTAASRIVLALAALSVSGQPSFPAEDDGPRSTLSDSDRPEDRAAIRSMMESFARALRDRDAKAIAAHWTTEGEYEAARGVPRRGRTALEGVFSDALRDSPGAEAEVSPGSIRFLGDATAIGEGWTRIERRGTDHANASRCSILFTREGGRWLIARLAETPPGVASIDELAWLVGEWESTAGQGADIRVAFSWSPSKRFLNLDFRITERGETLSGFQVLGVDPADGSLRAWMFEAAGGVGKADWTGLGDRWVIEATGFLADGSRLTETNLLRRVGEDAFTWGSVRRLHDDAKLADLAPVKLTRLKPAG